MQEVLANRGGPQRPLSDAELAVKFRTNAAALPEATAARIADEVHRLDQAPDVHGLMGLINRR